MLSSPRGSSAAHQYHQRLKRFYQDIKRRTTVVRIFPDREACLKLVTTAIVVEQSEK